MTIQLQTPQVKEKFQYPDWKFGLSNPTVCGFRQSWKNLYGFMPEDCAIEDIIFTTVDVFFTINLPVGMPIYEGLYEYTTEPVLDNQSELHYIPELHLEWNLDIFGRRFYRIHKDNLVNSVRAKSEFIVKEFIRNNRKNLDLYFKGVN